MNSHSELKILLVDDSQAIAGLYGEALRGRGYQVLTAFSGEEALEIAVREKPDIGLLDFHLPGITGEELTRRLLAHPVTEEMVIAIFSNYSDVTRKSLDAGAVDMISKGTPEELFNLRVDALARQALQKRHSRKQQVVRTDEEVADVDQLPPFKVLLVDDSKFVRSAYHAMLESIGCEVLLAENMQEALVLARKSQPHLAIVDFYMEGGNGDELTRELLLDPKTQNVMVVVLTSQQEIKDVALASGAIDVIAKGEDQSLFAQRIASIREYHQRIYRMVQQHTEKALEEKHIYDRIGAVFDVIQDPVMAINSSGIVTHVNQSLVKMVGRAPGELLGQCVADILVTSGSARCLRDNSGEQLQRFIDQKTVEQDLQSKTGELIPVRITVSPLRGAADDKQKLNGGLLVFHDVREIINAEELKRSNQARDHFMAAMSHELRTPLTSIIGNSQILGERLQERDDRELISSIEVAGRSQLALINDILDMSKIESGKFTIEENPYNLVTMLKEIEDLFAPQAEDAGLDFVVEDQVQSRFMLTGDQQRIRQILMNLLGNAIKFTAQGSVALTVVRDAEHLKFRVRDSGIGMSAAVVENLFQRFNQADNSISRRYGGSGLGLFISQELALLMEGRIEVESEEGSGSLFELVLPFRESEVTGESVQEDRTSSTLKRTFSGSVLVAEDTPLIQQLQKRMLEGMGLQVTLAGNGSEAVELAQQRNFDVVLMDMQMPEMDGIEATSVLRARGVTTPVIAVTANVMQKHREQFVEAGCDGFISKPIDAEALRALLAKYLD